MGGPCITAGDKRDSLNSPFHAAITRQCQKVAVSLGDGGGGLGEEGGEGEGEEERGGGQAPAPRRLCKPAFFVDRIIHVSAK